MAGLWGGIVVEEPVAVWGERLQASRRSVRVAAVGELDRPEPR